MEYRRSITAICFECGFNSVRSFSRAFKNSYGISPRDYRRLGYTPVTMSIAEIIEKFASKLRGGILVHPRMIKQGALLISGVTGTGDGSRTAELWQQFIRLYKQIGFDNQLSVL